jgi:hypothetical protein
VCFYWSFSDSQCNNSHEFIRHFHHFFSFHIIRAPACRRSWPLPPLHHVCRVPFQQLVWTPRLLNLSCFLYQMRAIFSLFTLPNIYIFSFHKLCVMFSFFTSCAHNFSLFTSCAYNYSLFTSCVHNFMHICSNNEL